MGTLYLVRHGQASFGADNYDVLSELGHRQALRLGQYLRERGVHCPHLARLVPHLDFEPASALSPQA